ncbi:hypothetical protein VTN00DRAFT_6519 [Thermoascus crustaceus]|uniref:uncharacterized protein n=1 Tax=Thermoascus crustaceus TaxID=5088 RepID=UPI0037428B50
METREDQLKGDESQLMPPTEGGKSSSTVDNGDNISQNDDNTASHPTPGAPAVGGGPDNDELGSKMIDAITKGSVDEVRELLASAGTTEIRFDYQFEGEDDPATGLTPLILSAAFGRDALVQLLLEHKADHSAKTISYKSDPLQLASRGGHLKVVEMLLADGADVHSTRDDGTTALHMAASNGHDVIAELLLEHRADLEAKDSDGWTPLYYASNKGYDKIVKTLLEKGAKVNEPTNGGWFPLHTAAEYGHTAAVELLLNHGADPDVKDVGGWTSLYFASSNGYDKVVDMLLEKGAKANEATNDGWTPLHTSAQDGDVTIVELLLSKGAADIEKEDNEGWTALLSAAYFGKDEVVKLLLSKGADTAKRDHVSKRNALHWASLERHDKVVQLLLDVEGQESIDRNALDSSGSTALHLAAWSGAESVVQKLLGDGRTDITIQDHDGDTALSDAANKGHVRVMVQLLETDVYFPEDPVKDKNCLATVSEASEIEEALSKGLDKEIESPHEIELIMYWAVLNGRQGLMQKCIDHGQNVKSWSRKKATWLHVAAGNGRYDVVQSLLKQLAMEDEQDAPSDIQDAVRTPPKVKYLRAIMMKSDSGESPLSLAVRGKYRQVEDVLWGEIRRVGTEIPNFLTSYPEEANQALELAAQFEKPGEERVLLHLLKHGADTQDPPLGANWTTLQWAVYRRQAVAVWWLLSNGGHLKSEEIENALKIAKSEENSEGGHGPVDQAITELLHNPPQILEKMAHSDDDDPPILQVPSDDDDRFSIGALQGTIVDFYRKEGQIDLQFKQLGVEALIYNLGPQQVMSDARKLDIRQLPVLKQRVSASWKDKREQSTVPERKTVSKGTTQQVSRTAKSPGSEQTKGPPETKGPQTEGRAKDPAENTARERSAELPGDLQFRWLHIPVNNMHLIEDLITRLSRDSKKKNKEHRPLISFIRRSWTELAAGGRKHYMKPQCVKESLEFKPPRSNNNQNENENADEELRLYDQTRDTAEATSTKDQPVPAAAENAAEMPSNAATDEMGRSRKDLKQKPIEKGSPSSVGSKKRLALYMPYLTLADKPANPTEQTGNANDSHSPGNQSPREQRGIAETGRGAPEPTGEPNKRRIVHEPMTLDQYYYATLDDTRERDDFQVISRYLDRERDKNVPKEPQILMVDQLWLWIIDEKTIITSTTRHPKQFDDIILRNVVDNLVFGEIKGIIDRPTSVESMMEFIIGITTGLFTQNKAVVRQQKLKSALEMFRESIRHVADIETKLFNAFEASLRETRKLSSKPKSGKDGNPSPGNPSGNSSSEGASDKKSSDNPYYNIAEETALLREIKDIRDELNILTNLAESQEVIWKQTFGTDSLEDRSNFKYFHSCTPTEVKQELQEMAAEAKIVQNSVHTLLDLRQKQASIREAEFGRQQAQDTAKQSNTVMVFTVVTIVFLPLSFLASLFALNVSEFPHESGSIQYEAWWIFPIIFGVSAAVSIPFIYVAFNVNSIMNLYSNWKKQPNNKNWQDGPNSSSSSSSSLSPLRTRNPSKTGGDSVSTRADLTSRSIDKLMEKSMAETEELSERQTFLERILSRRRRNGDYNDASQRHSPV